MKNCKKCNQSKPLVNLKYELCDDCNFFRLNGITKQEKYRRKSEENQLKKSVKVVVSDVKKQIVTIKELHPEGSFRFFHNNREEEYEGKRIKIVEIIVKGFKQYKVQLLEDKSHLYCTEYDIVKKLPIQREIKEVKIKQQTDKTRKNEEQLKKLKDSISNKAVKNGTYFCSGCGRGDEWLDRSHILSVKQRKDLELVEENIDLLCRSCHEKWESGNIVKMMSLNCWNRYIEYIRMNDEQKFYKLKYKIDEL